MVTKGIEEIGEEFQQKVDELFKKFKEILNAEKTKCIEQIKRLLNDDSLPSEYSSLKIKTKNIDNKEVHELVENIHDYETSLFNAGKIRRKLSLASKVLSVGVVMIEASAWFFLTFKEPILNKDEQFFIDFQIDSYYSDYKEHGKTEEDYQMAKQLSLTIKKLILLLNEKDKKVFWSDILILFKKIVQYSYITEKQVNDYQKYYSL